MKKIISALFLVITMLQVQAQTFKVQNLTVQGIISAAAGTSTTPTYDFTGATTTGLYWANPGIGFSIAGTGIGTITATGLNGMPIGASSASTVAATTLSASSTVSGAGFSTYLASPPAIGGSAAAAGSFTTLSASSTVSGAGFSTYLASPPAIGGSAPSTGAFTTLSTTGQITSTLATGTAPLSVSSTTPVTNLSIGGNAATATTATNQSGGTVAATTLSASSTVSGTGFSTYLASPPAIGGTVAAAGSFTTLGASGAVTLSPANAAVTLSPTGTGTVTINPATASTINNTSIGATTASTVRGTTLTATTGAITPSYPAGIVGVTTGSAVTAGSIGQIISGSNTVALSNGTSATVTNISLTAGNWLIFGSCQATPSGGAILLNETFGISSTAATLPAIPLYTINTISSTANQQMGFPMPTQNVNISGTTTYYSIANVGFASGSVNAICSMFAIRIS